MKSHFSLFRRLGAALMVGVAAVAFAPTAGAAYPDRPIKLIVSVAPGGLTDILARMLGQRLSERVGQPVIVENKVGGGGIIAMDFVAKSAPDGYTIAIGFPGPLAVNPTLYKKLPYDPATSFVPISLVAAWPQVMLVHPSVPANTVGELNQLLKKNPTKYSYGSGGNATTSHLTMELVKHQAGVHMVHVPYRGAAPLMTDLIAGNVQVSFDSLALGIPQAQAGKVKILGVTTAKRTPLAPNLATLSETGLPGFEVTGWYGFVAPAGTPQPIVARLAQEFVAMVQEPAMKEQLAARGVEPIGKGSAEFAAFLASEAKRWGEIVQSRNITVDQ